MKFKNILIGLPATLLTLSLLGCGGGNGDFVAYVGGTVSGLGSGKSVALENNNDETILVTQNGTFRFDKRLVIGERYDVRVKTLPAGQLCVVTQGTGNINSRSEDITNVLVTCQ